MCQPEDIAERTESGTGNHRPDGQTAAATAVNRSTIEVSREPTYIVGIGASAGGLEALERFFDHMPADTGLAFVVVPHLSPDFKSLMGELLSKRTRMAVRQVSDGMRVEANTISVIPPRKNMIIAAGRLMLTDIEPPHGLNLPIDIFFRSLAQDLNDRAIGVILSGTGSDGTRGIRAIKEAGGMVMVQDDATAKFDGMPRSAIATGLADHVLAPEHMPQQLLNFTKYPSGMEAALPVVLATADDKLGEIFNLLRSRHGLDFSQYKPAMVGRRIERRMIVHQLEELGQYLTLLRESADELKKLYTELLIHVTAFFRDTDAFARLEALVVCKLIENASPEETIRVWVPACSTGEEAYSLAMLFQEEQQRQQRRADVKIFATDVDEQAVEQAGRGVFPASIASDLTKERLEQFFIKYGDTYQFSPLLRKTVIFAPHNVVKDPPFTKLDLIACRNLLIYLQPEVQKKILSMFHFALNPRGFLFLGASETVGELAGDFDALDVKWRIYQKTRPTRLPLDDRSALLRSARGLNSAVDLSSQIRSTPTDSIISRAYETLVLEYAPPGLLVNERRELLYVFGDVSGFLRVPPGKPNQDVLRMVSDDLAVVLGTAMHKALSDGGEVYYQNVNFKGNATPQRIDLRVKPLPKRRFDEKASENLLLVLIRERKSEEQVTPAGDVLDAAGISTQRITDIEQELRQTRENLQATIEELETSNEELQATNEELVAANEELQGTNEELQSVNEELFTVNAEYQKKIAELTEANNDIDNLFRITDIGKIFLDREGRVRRYTPAATAIVNLLENDIGRPIGHFSHSLIDVDLPELFRQVQGEDEPVVREVRTRNGQWVMMRVLPYRVATRSGDGVIITFIDVSNIKQSEAALRESEAKFHDFYDHAPDLFATLEIPTGVVLDCNAALAGTLGRLREQIVGRRIGELLAIDSVPAANRALIDFAQAGSLRNLEQQFQRADGSLFDVILNASGVRDEQDRIVYARAVWHDISERKAAEVRIRRYAEDLEASQKEVERQAAELKNRNLELARSNKELDDFAHIASHDLKEPLQSLLFNCRFLAEDFASRLGADGHARLASLVRQAERMAELVDSLLQFSRFSRLELTLQDVDLSAVVADVIASLDLQIADAHAEIVMPRPLPVVRADPAVSALFRNLITNALKYNDKARPRVEIAVLDPAPESTETATVFYVRDNGIGIPARDHEKVFEIFRRLHGPEKFGGGTGAGLTIARKIVERHGGKIWLQSQIGEGTTFYFTLQPERKN
jgi:two-component system CheB/CheR fusion protein